MGGRANNGRAASEGAAEMVWGEGDENMINEF